MVLQRSLFTFSFAEPAKLKFKRFWRWWSAELRALVPVGLSRWLERDASMVDVSIAGTRIALLKVGVNSVSEEKQLDLMGMESAARQRALQELLRSRAGDIRVVLDAEFVLRKRLMLPQATEENLREVLAFDMDRQTPFKAAQVYYDGKVIRRDHATGMIYIELCLALREDVDSLLAPLREAGIAIAAIGVRDDVGGAAPHLNLLPADQRTAHKLRWQQILNRVLMVLVGLLTIAAVVLPIWQKRETVIAMLPLLDRARGEALITDRISSEYTRLFSEYSFIVTKKQGMQPAIALLEEVTKILPDNTWVQHFELRQTQKAREIQVSGETASASKLIEIFEQSQMLQNSTQRAQVVRGTMPGTERYQIAAEVKPRPLPELDAAAPPAAPVSVPVAAGTSSAPSEGVKP